MNNIVLNCLNKLMLKYFYQFKSWTMNLSEYPFKVISVSVPDFLFQPEIDPDVEIVEESLDIADIEETGSHTAGKRMHETPSPPTVTKKRKVDRGIENTEFVESDLLKSWKQVLGNPPAMGTTKVKKFSNQFLTVYFNFNVNYLPPKLMAYKITYYFVFIGRTTNLGGFPQA